MGVKLAVTLTLSRWACVSLRFPAPVSRIVSLSGDPAETMTLPDAISTGLLAERAAAPLGARNQLTLSVPATGAVNGIVKPPCLRMLRIVAVFPCGTSCCLSRAESCALETVGILGGPSRPPVSGGGFDVLEDEPPPLEVELVPPPPLEVEPVPPPPLVVSSLGGGRVSSSTSSYGRPTIRFPSLSST